MDKRDYYEVLGLKKGATGSEIKKAYRTLAKENHPDKNQGDKDAEERFKEIAEAYETLSDDEKKSKYDKFGHSSGNNAGFGGFNPFEGFDFGFGGQTKPERKGADMSLLVNLTLEEIYTGVKKKYKYNRNVSCEPCDGNGGTDIVDCSECNGNGFVQRVLNTPIGQIAQTLECSSCDGIGRKHTKNCGSCHGKGTVEKEEVVEVDVPIGVQNGMTFGMSGKGQAIRGGKSGDLHIRVSEKPHKKYVRVGNDLRLNLKLNYPQLILGDKIEIETIDGGKIRASVPEYSNVGANLRIPSKGMKFFRDDKTIGDLIITLDIEIPTKVSDETKSLLIDLKEKMQSEVDSKGN